MKLFTVVVRGPNNKGHRWLIKAHMRENAMNFAIKLCHKRDLDFVAIFDGHMKAAARIPGIVSERGLLMVESNLRIAPDSTERHQ